MFTLAYSRRTVLLYNIFKILQIFLLCVIIILHQYWESSSTKGAIMSNRKLNRYIKDTNDKFATEHLEITYSDETSTLRLESAKHIKLTCTGDYIAYAKAITSSSHGCMVLTGIKDGMLEIFISQTHPRFNIACVKETLDDIIIILSIPQKVKRTRKSQK